MVRQYRYLLATAPVDALEGIHVEMLDAMSGAQRGLVLQALGDAFGTGRHLGADEVRKIAHLIATGAARHPRAWLEGLPPAVARELAEDALNSEAAFGRLNGYVDWDGTSAEPTDHTGPNDGFDPTANRYRVDADPRFNEPGGIGGGG